MWHKPCRTFHPWCPCIKTRCLLFYVCTYQRCNQTLAAICRNMCICNVSRAVAARRNTAWFLSSCRGPNASNPARGRTLPGQERPSNGRPDASQRRPGSMLCPVGLPGALSVDILALLLYWPTYAPIPGPITVRLTCTNHSAYILIFYFC